MEEEKTSERLTEVLRIGGYLTAGGAFVGFSIGLYLLLNRTLFSFFIRIGAFEVMSYFLGVFMPSFIILIVIGYLFATTFGLKKTELSNVVSLCVLSFLSIVLSALSVFYFISFLGGFLTLTALIKAYTKPMFKTLSKREAFFMVEIGAMLVASFSALSLLMWLLSNVFQTYAMGSYVSYSPYALMLVGVISFLMFFSIPLWGSQGANAGVCGALGLVMTILSYLFVVQNQYVLFNAPAYIGIFMLVLGFISALFGELLYVRLFFSAPTEPTDILTLTPLYDGKYCPYCGKQRVTSSQNLCSDCGRSLMWTPYAPFCSSCGRLVPTLAQTCPHCKENIGSKRIYFQLRDTTEQAVAGKLVTESRKKRPWIINGLLKMAELLLQAVGRGLDFVSTFFNAVIERLSLTLKEVVVIIILTYLLGFVSFVGYVRVESSKPVPYEHDAIVFSYGLPLQWILVTAYPISYVYDVAILWIPLAFDVVLYFLVSLALVYGVAKLRH